MLCTERHSVFFLHFWCSVGTALAILCGYIAALFVGGVLVLQDVFDAILQAIQSSLRAWSLGEGAGLRLLWTSGLGHSAPARRQDVDPYSVHCKSRKLRV